MRAPGRAIWLVRMRVHPRTFAATTHRRPQTAAMMSPVSVRSACIGGSAAALPLARVRVLVADEADPKVSIQLDVNGKQRTFNRPANGQVEATLRRMEISLTGRKSKEKKTKKAKGDEARVPHAATDQRSSDEPALVATLRATDGRVLARGLTNAEAWRSGNVLELGGVGAWRIGACLPHVISFCVPGADRPMVGFTLRPNVVLEHADAAADCQWKWTRTPYSPSDNQQEVIEEPVLSDRQEYTPTEDDIGHTLRVRCLPTRGGILYPDSLPAETMTGCVCTSDIEGAAGIDIVQMRSAWTAAGPTDSRGFRVMSYNILANVYGNTAEAREELFPYCPTAALDIDYRAQLVIREIIASKADIVCLQEVDRTVFNEFLRPALLHAGYDDGFLLEKSASSREGVAMFVRGFQVDQYVEVYLGGGGDNSGHHSDGTNTTGSHQESRSGDYRHTKLEHTWREREVVQQLAEQGTCGAETMRVLKSVSTKGQLLVLRRKVAACSSDPDDDAQHEREQVLVIGNTHLHYHPLCSHIRALQLEHFLSAAHDKVTQLQDTSVAPAFVLCGDLNAQPGTSAGVLLRAGRLNRQHPDWSRLNRFFVWDPTPAQTQQADALLRDLRSRERAARKCGVTSVWDDAVELALHQSNRAGREGLIETIDSTMVSAQADDDHVPPYGVDLSQPFDFDWVDHDFTNYCGADSFIGRLDYILPESTTLRVARTAPMPKFEQAALATGWPCVGHPSDHVSLLYDLTTTPHPASGGPNFR